MREKKKIQTKVDAVSLFHTPIYAVCKEKFPLCKYPSYIILHLVQRIITMPFEKTLVDDSLHNHFMTALTLLHYFAVGFVSYCNPNNGIYYFKPLFC